MSRRVYASGLTAGQYKDLLRADFADLENVDKIINTTLYKLMARDYKSSQAYKYGVSFSQWSAEGLKESGGFATLVRQRLGQALAVVRANAVKKAGIAIGPHDRGMAQRGISRRMYKGELAGNINIASPRRRMSSKRRPYTPGTQRTVSNRTRALNEYYGIDRSFILRILESGRDEFMAHSESGAKGRGSKASWGRRGALAPRSFFHTMHADMEEAARNMGQDLTQFVEQILNEN